MTDKAVSALTSLTGANTATGDLLYIVDISEAAAADRSKKITAEELQNYVKKFPATIGVGGATPAASGAGISFPATASASSDANTLDDYEEGTHTTTLSPSDSGTVALKAGNDLITYTKIGNKVTVTGQMIVNTVSSPVGFFYFTLPFAIFNYDETAGRGSPSVTLDGVVSANVGDFTAISVEGETIIRVYLGDGTSNQTDSAQQLQANTEVFFTFTYFA